MATTLKNNYVASFCESMSLILHAGIAPYEGIGILKDENEDKVIQPALDGIYEGLDKGDSLYDSIASTGMFPEYMMQMVKIGETSGRLEEVMDGLQDHYHRLYENTENLRSALSYPMIMIIMMLAVVIVLMTQVLPIFNRVFVQLGSTISGFSRVIMNIGIGMSRYSIIFIIFLIALVGLYYYLMKTDKGRETMSDFLAKASFSKDLSLKMALSKFTSGMAIGLSSGLDIDESFRLSKSLVDHKGLKAQIDEAENIMHEKDIAEGLTEAKVITGMHAQLIKLGYKTGGMDQIFRNISKNYDEEANDSIVRMIGIIEPTLVAILSVLTGIILLSVMLPLIGIMSSL